MELLETLQTELKNGGITQEQFNLFASKIPTPAALPCRREDLFLYNIDLNAFQLFGKLDEQGVQILYDTNPEAFRHYIWEGYQYLTSINWNKYNEQKSKGVTFHFNIMEHFVPLPRHNGAKLSSFLEAYVIFHTSLGRAKYEDKASYIEYKITATYKPDFISPSNPLIIFETKGIFRDAAEAKKYKLIAEQTGRVVIFIFLARDIEIPWQKKRKDGSRQTHEQWCQKNGFLYTYADQFDEFIKSPAYRALL